MLKLEPGEADEMTADFFLEADDLRLVEVYTYFRNVKDKAIGWGAHHAQ
jgi:hypothetical protein